MKVRVLAVLAFAVVFCTYSLLMGEEKKYQKPRQVPSRDVLELENPPIDISKIKPSYTIIKRYPGNFNYLPSTEDGLPSGFPQDYNALDKIKNAKNAKEYMTGGFGYYGKEAAVASAKEITVGLLYYNETGYKFYYFNKIEDETGNLINEDLGSVLFFATLPKDWGLGKVLYANAKELNMKLVPKGISLKEFIFIAPTPKCEDSDAGRNEIYNKGHVSINGTIVATDRCIQLPKELQDEMNRELGSPPRYEGRGSKLIEVSCTSSGGFDENLYMCKGECLSGACVD